MILYVDPGSGVLIWQLVISFFLGIIFYLAKIKGWASSWFRRTKAGGSTTSVTPTETVGPED
jgi:hypothetical protein